MKTKLICQKIVAVLLTLTIIVSSMWVSQFNVFATTKSSAFDGSGTEVDPYQIKTKADLILMRDKINIGDVDYNNKSYILINDIDLIGENWIPIGIIKDANYFRGDFDGNNKTISNIRIGTSLNPYKGGSAGFFGTIDDSNISNLKIKNIDIFSEKSIIGGFVGLAGVSKEININNCEIEGSIHLESSIMMGGFVGAISKGNISNSSSNVNFEMKSALKVGGFIGRNSGGVINNCEAKGKMIIEDASNVGGFVGDNKNEILNSHSDYTILAQKGFARIGGFVGENFKNIVNSYSNGSINIKEGQENLMLGGFAGLNESGTNFGIQNSYSTLDVTLEDGDKSNVGGFVGINKDLIVNTYFAGGLDIKGTDIKKGSFVGSAESSTILKHCYCLKVQGLDIIGVDQTGTGSSMPVAMGKSDMQLFAGKTGALVDSLNDNFTSMDKTSLWRTSEWNNWYVHPLENESLPNFKKTNPVYKITYEDNGATSGNVPINSLWYEKNHKIILEGNTGSLAKTGYKFLGWSEVKDGSLIGEVIVDASDIVVYAKWEEVVNLDGSGTDMAPYQIKTKEDLILVRDKINVGNTAYNNKSYIIINDIDLVGENWIPIGIEKNNHYFKGNIYGNDKSIINLNIGTKLNPETKYDSVGFFGVIDGATVQNLTLDNVKIYAKASNIGGLVGRANSTKGASINDININGEINGVEKLDVGGLIGYATNANIINSHTNVVINATKGSVGGFVGVLENGVINHSGAKGNVTVATTADAVTIGGFIGKNSAVIENSYAKVNVTVTTGSNIIIGGFAGKNEGNNAAIKNSYATGDSLGKGIIGGFIGENNSLILNSYSTGDVQGDNPLTTGSFAGVTETQGKMNYTYSIKITGKNGIGNNKTSNQNLPVLMEETKIKSREGIAGALVDILNSNRSITNAEKDWHIEKWLEWFIEPSENDGVPGFEKYTHVYSILYDKNGAIKGSVPLDINWYKEGAKVILETNTGNLEKTGYNFLGWSETKDGVVVNEVTVAKKDIILYAKWEEKPKYTITYDGNGATNGNVEIDSNKYEENEKIKLKFNTGNLEKTGYKFLGWSETKDGVVVSEILVAKQNIIVYARWEKIPKYTITYDSNGATIGNVPVDNNQYKENEKIIPEKNIGNLEKTGYNFLGWSRTKDGTLINEVIVYNQDIVLYAKWGVKYTSSKKDKDKDEEKEEVLVIINGEKENAGEEIHTRENGRPLFEIEVNTSLIKEKIKKANEKKNTIEIPINYEKSDITRVGIFAEIVEELKAKDFTIVVSKSGIEYDIPAREIEVEKLEKELGSEKENVEIYLEISKVTEKEMEKYKGDFVIKPIHFAMYARNKGNGQKEKRVKIDKFKSYVKRIIEIPSQIDASKITTGIIFNEDGTYEHVPTTIFKKDGSYYASIKSLTNSVYAVISNPVKVKGVENHWSKDIVNDMAGRLIIIDTKYFKPEEAITRGEFADYIVRALGLYRKDLKQTEIKFIDLKQTDNMFNSIMIANEWEIVKGYTDGTFKPENTITREEAMVMFERAMKIAKVEERNKERINGYKDKSKISDWAYDSVTKAIGTEIFNGMTEDIIQPKGIFTKSEAATAIRNLLVEANLINE